VTAEHCLDNWKAEETTNYRQSWNCCDRGLVSSWSENISVSFCLWAPGYGLTLWCALGLLVGDAVQVPQLLYNKRCLCDEVAGSVVRVILLDWLGWRRWQCRNCCYTSHWHQHWFS